MHRTDEQLVAAYVADGDDLAFRTLLERHQERVFGYLVGMVRDPALADDLFQETFMRIIDALQHRRGSYMMQGKFGAWAIRIARNAALDHLRRRRRLATSGDGVALPAWEDVMDAAPSASDILEMDEQSAWLETCIAQLPPDQREVLLLRHEAELTFKEIAALTGCSINTALGRMRYAIKNLRRIMEESGKARMIRAQ